MNFTPARPEPVEGRSFDFVPGPRGGVGFDKLSPNGFQFGVLT
jgi:hypothetical protein